MKWIKLVSLFLIANAKSAFDNEEVISITPYDYPKPWKEGDADYTVAILSTNDIHGAYFPMTGRRNNKTDYLYGGLEYLGRYVEVMREDWDKDFLYFDVGDQFQGSIENTLSKGELMTGYFNIIGLDGATFGNHEWDYGLDFIKTRLEKSKVEYVVSNIQNKKGEREFLPKQKQSKIFNTAKAKIGVIGITVDLTHDSSSGHADVKQIQFVRYDEAIKGESTKLKNLGADVVVLIAHLGFMCPDEDSLRFKLEMREKGTSQKDCKTNEVIEFIKKMPPGIVDVMITAHAHDVAHHWINGIPVMSNIANSEYASIMYLSFAEVNGKMVFQPAKVQIESPLPVCEKVFSNTLRCGKMTPKEVNEGNLLDFTFHGHTMGKTASLNDLTAQWKAAYEDYSKQVVTRTNDVLIPKRDAENPIGNLYTDFMRKKTKAQVAVINGGFFRTQWGVGAITAAQVIQMSPYLNEISSFTMTGKELRRMMFTLQAGPRAFYPTSGLKQVVKANPMRLVALKLFDGLNERNIVDDEEYRVASIDFCIPGGGDDFRQVMEWYKVKDLKMFGDIRDEAIKYFKFIKEINIKDVMDVNQPRLRTIPE